MSMLMPAVGARFAVLPDCKPIAACVEDLVRTGPKGGTSVVTSVSVAYSGCLCRRNGNVGELQIKSCEGSCLNGN